MVRYFKNQSLEVLTLLTLFRVEELKREEKGTVLVDHANYSLNSIRIQETTCNLYILCWQFFILFYPIFFPWMTFTAASSDPQALSYAWDGGTESHKSDFVPWLIEIAQNGEDTFFHCGFCFVPKQLPSGASQGIFQSVDIYPLITLLRLCIHKIFHSH